MTGIEAWQLISPILAKYVTEYSPGKLDPFSEAYVTIYCALKEYDERTDRNEMDERARS